MGNILRICDVSHSFGTVAAVNGVSLDIRRGVITALIGPNGAGKTTLFNVISGYVRPRSGQVLYRGRHDTRWQDLSRHEPWRIARMGVGRLFQDLRTFERMSVLDNVLAAFPRQPGERFRHALLMRRYVLHQEWENTDRAFDLLETAGLAGEAYSPAGELSYGQQKLLSIVRLLAAGQEMLLLDEPTAGLSPPMIERVRQLILQLVRGGNVRRNERRTVVVIEHNLSVVDRMADWTCMMNAGRIEYFEPGGLGGVFRDRARRGSYIGLDASGGEPRPPARPAY